MSLTPFIYTGVIHNIYMFVQSGAGQMDCAGVGVIPRLKGGLRPPAATLVPAPETNRIGWCTLLNRILGEKQNTLENSRPLHWRRLFEPSWVMEALIKVLGAVCFCSLVICQTNACLGLGLRWFLPITVVKPCTNIGSDITIRSTRKSQDVGMLRHMINAAFVCCMSCLELHWWCCILSITKHSIKRWWVGLIFSDRPSSLRLCSILSKSEPIP